MTDVYRPTPTEASRLTDYCTARRAEGYSQKLIGAAIGLKQSTVSRYLQNAGAPQRTVYSSTALKTLPPLEPFDWRDKPIQKYQTGPVERVDVPVAYKASTTVDLLSSTLRQLRADSALVRFAHDVEDASDAADNRWVTDAATIVNQLQGYLAGLVKVLDDDTHRHRVIRDPMYRDEMQSARPYLHAVNDTPT